MGRIRRTALVFASIMVLASSVLGGTTAANADDPSAGETHTISGRTFALDSDGSPTIGVPVYIAVLSPSGDAAFYGSSDSGGSGDYVVNNVPDGDYVIEYTWQGVPDGMAPTGFVTTWAGGTPYRSEASIVSVAGADVVQDVEMPRGGAITGIFTTTSPSQRDYRIIDAYIKEPDGSLRLVAGTVVTGATVTTDGSYRLRGLADADYVIRYSQRSFLNEHEFETQYWPDQRTRQTAQFLHPQAEATISGIDVTLRPWSPESIERLSGGDRFEAAAAISTSQFAPGVPVVFIANGLNYPDALSAGPAAVRMGGPVLLVTPHSVPESIAAELERLQPARIVVVGGEASVDAAVFGQLGGYAPRIQRIGGADRYEVSRNVARLIVSEPGHEPLPDETNIVFADGRGFADALTAGAAVSLTEGKGAVVLVDGSKQGVDAATDQFIREIAPSRLYIAGGPNSISPGFEDGLSVYERSVTRIGGADRFEVSAGIAGYFPARGSGEKDVAYFAVGTNFPDALAGAAVAGARLTNLYIVHPDCVPGSVLERIRIQGQQSIRILGGLNSVGRGAEELTPC